jgi:hypothetical protein
MSFKSEVIWSFEHSVALGRMAIAPCGSRGRTFGRIVLYTVQHYGFTHSYGCTTVGFCFARTLIRKVDAKQVRERGDSFDRGSGQLPAALLSPISLYHGFFPAMITDCTFDWRISLYHRGVSCDDNGLHLRLARLSLSWGCILQMACFSALSHYCPASFLR